MRRPIKHILDDTVTDEAGAVVRSIHLCQGVTGADPYAAAQSAVNAGSAIVKRIHLMLEVAVNNSIVNNAYFDRFDWYIWFNIAGAQSAPDPRTAGQYDLKNQIFHQGHALLGVAVTAASNNGSFVQAGRATWDMIINIPTWAQKINKDDLIDLVYVHSDSAANKWLKLKAIYFEIEQS